MGSQCGWWATATLRGLQLALEASRGEAAAVTWWRALLGHDGTARPCEVTVTYGDGSTGTLSIWVRDMPDALLKAMDWIAERDNISIRSIVFDLRDRPRETTP